ncbi:RNA-binding protein (Nab3) [Penicillium chermesinum]|uniref:RNA-binding protein (Nab3) n=1 Tax=Penicillium chermesinum TaxID=63820 RepID=A0A9W9P9T2_9EURO|nr:RNA-binding protein (Nab3) [Penicillium chermesinum]KAJ5240146.1 RNA-binding protein (Nab3) [Penicillium chermesinum]
MPTFQTPSTGGESHSSQEPSQIPKKGRADKQPARPGKGSDDDSPWGPEVQKKYDEFLHDERIYVTEGLWDRFPIGSRLFVGNLPTERVTKRDMFHLFHKYGKLAQISIKQAYGFIQFLEAGSCQAALQAEQGALVRGRKIRELLTPPIDHKTPNKLKLIQTSKFPNPNGLPDQRQQSPLAPLLHVARDLQSFHVLCPLGPPPEHRATDMTDLMSRVGSHSVISETSLRIAGVMIIAPHGRHRPDLSGPEMGIGLETEHQSASIVAIDDDLVLLAPAPRPRGVYDGEAELPVPRRSIRDVPEVQILVLEEVDRNFILHVENAFRNRGLRVDVLVLGPRIPLGAAVHRQYVEGVLAVVRLSRPNQFSRKIPLQIFDRSAGPTHVRFTGDYPEVDANIAAEVMFHQAQAMQRPGPPASFAPNPAFGVQPVPQVPIPQPGLPALNNPSNMANLISSLDGPSLQNLLSALQRPNPQSQPVSAAQSPFSSPNPPPPADLAALLTNAARQPPIPPTQPPLPSPSFNLQPPHAPVVSDPHLLSILAKGLGGQQPQGQPAVGSNVQNLMNQLAKWKQ